jgi:hypothetical protein
MSNPDLPSVAHIEFLVEEQSTQSALNQLLPRILGPNVKFAIHAFNGKADLLKKLPNRLRGYRRWLPGNWRIVVLVDEDRQDCYKLKQHLETIAHSAGFTTPQTATNHSFIILNRIAVEELEAWFFGDVPALVKAYPRLPENLGKQATYRIPDEIKGGTWEQLEKVLQNHGYHRGGLEKIRAAQDIAQYMNPDQNTSKSFQVWCDGLRRLLQT